MTWVVPEAERRGVEPDALVDEIVRTDLGQQGSGDLDAAPDTLGEVRAGPDYRRSTRSRYYVTGAGGGQRLAKTGARAAGTREGMIDVDAVRLDAERLQGVAVGRSCASVETQA